MYRTQTCGELNLSNKGAKVVLSGWVQTIRDKGHLMWIDLRDRYGITQLILEEGKTKTAVLEKARTLGREFVIRVEGEVIERSAKNDKIPTGEIEVELSELSVLNASKTPPFTIENETDGGDELRMKYRYLDLRRKPVRDNMLLRHAMLQETRGYLSSQGFIEIETPYLIKSTPEGARDFVVPSRMNQGQFYALPQSPQTFKQLLMVSGFDRYFQIVRCFRDEDLRADRQPEFTQIDCEMSFVNREDVMHTFEAMIKHIFKKVANINLGDVPVYTYKDVMEKYGSDKPDLRFGMELHNLNELAKGNGFVVFDNSESVLAINAESCGEYSRKQLDALTKWVQRPQIGAKGLVYVKCNSDGSFKSSVDKFYSQEDLSLWAEKTGAKVGDLILILAGKDSKTRKALSELRLEMGDRLGQRKQGDFKSCWVIDFPLLEQDEESRDWHAMHHPFTAPLAEDLELLYSDPGATRATAYDMVINGWEVGGGSIRIHDRAVQERMFDVLGFSKEDAEAQFGFLMGAFEYGAPPHGGIAYGFDRLCSVIGGQSSIRDYIAFPKNNSGRDVMIDSPSAIDEAQKVELGIKLR